MFGRKSITIAASVAAVTLIVLGVLSLLTKAFVIDVILHIFIRMLSVVLIAQILKKCFKEQLADRVNPVVTVCSCVISVDLVLLDAIRYILHRGVSSVLFLPACLPVCFMIIISCSVPSTGADQAEIRRWAYLIGIPLLLLSLYFEVLAFL